MRSDFDEYLLERPDAGRVMGIDVDAEAVMLCMGRVIGDTLFVDQFLEFTRADWDEMKGRLLS